MPPLRLQELGLGRLVSTDKAPFIERSLRSKVTFAQINLNQTLPETGDFDVIFLRNVMIYFDQETKQKVVARVCSRLKKGGYFLIGHSENLNGVSDALRLVSPSIYRKD